MAFKNFSGSAISDTYTSLLQISGSNTTGYELADSAGKAINLLNVTTLTSASSIDVDAITSASITGSELTFYKRNASTSSITLPSGGSGTSTKFSTGSVVNNEFISSSAVDLSSLKVLIGDGATNVKLVVVNGELTLQFGNDPAGARNGIIGGFNGLGFNVDRFNQQLDSFSLRATYTDNQATFRGAKIFTGSTELVSQTTTNTPLDLNILGSSGSQNYRFEYEIQQPGATANTTLSASVPLVLNKAIPTNPFITETPDIESSFFNTPSRVIEYGATGSIAFNDTQGNSNSWEFVTFLNTQAGSNLVVNPSASVPNVSVTASYRSPVNTNIPRLNNNVSASVGGWSRVKSIRIGGYVSSSLNANDIRDIGTWGDAVLFNQITPNNRTRTFTKPNGQFSYIIYDALQPKLTRVIENDLTTTTIYLYKGIVDGFHIYRSDSRATATTKLELKTT